MTQFRMILKRAVWSKRFFLAVATLTMLVVAVLWKEGQLTDRNQLYLIIPDLAFRGPSSSLYMIIAAIPFSTGFLEDWQHNTLIYNWVRSGITRYTHQMIVATATTGFLVVLISYANIYILFRFVLSTSGGTVGLPELSAQVRSVLELYAISPNLYFLLSALLLSVSGAFWSVYSMLSTTYLPNVFVAMAAPLFTSKLLVVIRSILRTPLFLHYDAYVSGSIQFDSWVTSFLVSVFVLLMLVILIGIWTSIRMKRIFEHG